MSLLQAMDNNSSTVPALDGFIVAESPSIDNKVYKTKAEFNL